MISAGEVGAIFTIKDDASLVLKALMDQFNALQVSIDKTKLALAELKFPPGLNRSIGNMDKAFLSAGNTADMMAAKASGGLAKIDTSVGVTQGRIAALKAEMRTLSVGGASGLPALQGGPSGLRSRGAHSGGSGQQSALHTNIHAGPAGMRTHDNELIAGAVAAFGIWEALKASADLQQVQMNLRGGGVSNAEIEKATKIAYEVGQKYGLPARDVLQSMNEIRNPLNKGQTADSGVESALGHIDLLSQLSVVLKNKRGGAGNDTAREIYDLVKSGEFRNAIGDADFDHAMKSMVAANVATGGIVTPRDWLQVSQKLRGALPALSDDYLYKVVPELIQEFGGAQGGTAGSSLYQQLVAGSMRTMGVTELQRLGLVSDDPNKVSFDKNGRVLKMLPGGYKDEAEFMANPMEGMADIVDAMNKHGITGMTEQREEFATIFGNRVAAQLALTLAYQSGRLNRGAQGISSAEDPTTFSQQLLKDNPYTQWDQFTAAATNAGASIGSNLMPGATEALNSLTTAANAFGQIFSGKGTADAIRKALFGNGPVPKAFDAFMSIPASPGTEPDPGAAERRRLFGSLNPSGKVTPSYLSTNPNLAGIGAPTIPSITTNVTAPITAPLTGTATVTTGAINIVVSGASIAAALAGEIKGMVAGAFSGLGRVTGSSNGHDIQASPQYPDHAIYHGM